MHINYPPPPPRPHHHQHQFITTTTTTIITIAVVVIIIIIIAYEISLLYHHSKATNLACVDRHASRTIEDSNRKQARDDNYNVIEII